MTQKQKNKNKVFQSELNKPIKFLALEWIEPSWEFDHPTLLLEPIIRFTDCHTGSEGIIEDTAIDICIDTELKKSIRLELSDCEASEFQWRGWNLKNFKRVAKQSLKGKKFPKLHYKAIERYFVFFRNKDNEIDFKEAKP